METTTLTQDEIEAKVEAHLPQPRSSRISAVLNGLGNGVMLGGAVFAVPKLIASVRGHTPPEVNPKSIVFATVAGSVLGTWYGLHEAKQLEEYRDKIGEEIIKTRDRVHTLEGKVNHLQASENRRHSNDNARGTHAEKLAVKREHEDALER